MDDCAFITVIGAASRIDRDYDSGINGAYWRLMRLLDRLETTPRIGKRKVVRVADIPSLAAQLGYALRNSEGE